MNTAKFETRAEAQAFADRLDAMSYELSHGEHSRPDYQVRKIRGRDEYEIFARYHYYYGSLNAPQNSLIGADFVAWFEESAAAML